MRPTNRIPTHPGRILLVEFMEPMELTQVALAKDIGVPLQRVNELINGKRGISADTAWKLSGYFGNSPEFWMNLQVAFDLARTRPKKVTRGVSRRRA